MRSPGKDRVNCETGGLECTFKAKIRQMLGDRLSFYPTWAQLAVNELNQHVTATIDLLASNAPVFARLSIFAEFTRF